jgi:hypothetical protein
MINRGKDPVVKATEKQTTDLIKGLNKPPIVFNMLEAIGIG